MSRLKLLGTKELVYLSFPIILWVMFYFVTVDFFKDFVTAKWKLPNPAQPETFSVPYKIRTENINLSEIESIITVKPYKAAVKPKTAQKKESPPQYKISFIYIGKDRYVIINGKLLKEGENISRDEKIIKIYRDGVLLKGKWGERWIRFLN